MRKIERSLPFFIMSLMLFFGQTADGHAAAKKRGWLGVSLQELTPSMRDALNIGDRDGLLVNEVFDDSPAEEAGLEEGDVILEYDGKKVSRSKSFARMVRNTRPGTKVKLKIWRDEKEREIEVEIGRRRIPGMLRVFPEGGASVFTVFMRPQLGVQIHELDGDLAEYFEVDAGLLVLEVNKDSPAEEAGMKPGDVIVKIEGEAIEEVGDIHDILEDYEEGDEVKVEIVRHGKRQEVTVELEGPGAHDVRFFGRGKNRFWMEGPDSRIIEELRIRVPTFRSEIDVWQNRLRDEQQRLREKLEKARLRSVRELKFI